MSIIQICVLFVGISFCLAFIGLSFSVFSRFSMRFFLLYLLLETLNFSFDWLLIHPQTHYKAAWFALMMASSFLMAPCVWLFAREINQNSPPKIWPPAWGQCTVVALGFMLVVPLFVDAHSGNLLIDPSVPPGPLSKYIHTTMVSAVVLYLLQVPWYLRRCLHLFQKRIRTDKFLFSSIDEPALNALRALIWVMAGNWVLGLAKTTRSMVFEWSRAWDLFFSICEVGVALAALYAIFKRFWLYSVEDQRMLQSLTTDVLDADTGTKSEKEAAKDSKPDSKTKKYSKSALDEAIRNRVLKKVLSALEEQKIYRVNNLKLQDLCNATGESPHYISQVINQELGKNFFDLINHYRIEETKDRLIKERDASVLEIALDAGFNSKSTFNKAFKSATGKTPSAFRS